MLPILWLIIGVIIAVLLPERKPVQIALATALGAVVGLISKDNLLVLSFLLIIFLMPVNLGVALISAGLFSWLGMLLDPFADKLGSFFLHLTFVQNFGSLFFELPLVAWTSLNNTVVLGQLLFGLILFWPIYKAAFLISTTVLPKETVKPKVL